MKKLLAALLILAVAALLCIGCPVEEKLELPANQTPAAADFDIGNLTQTAGSVAAVTVTPKTGKSTGAITVYYNGSTTRPTAAGTYTITFDVAAAAGWKAATGLAAGTLTINATNQNPVASDFDIGNLTQTVGGIVVVTITPKTGKSAGVITICYNGSTTLPTTVGTYTVTFDVAAATGWNAVTALAGGTLTINATNQNPAASDFDIGNVTQAAGSVTAVTITPRVGKSAGSITIYYNGSTTLPTTAGTYTVTFDVAAAIGWNAAAGLYGGNLVISNQTPVASDFNFGNLTQTVGSIVAVTITPKSGKSTGDITIRYNGSTTLPATVGIYTITFDVAAAAGWNAANWLVGETLTINATNQNPAAADFDIGNVTQTAGSVTAVTITPKVGKSAGAVTIRYDGSTTLPTTGGTYAITFDVAAAMGWNAATGLDGGNLVIDNQTPVESDFDIGNVTQLAGSVTAVTVTPRAGKSTGVVTVYYNGSITLPSTGGTYTITFDVAAAAGWSAATELDGGNLFIGNPTPVESDFDIGNLMQTVGSVTTVTITPKAGKSAGDITIRYNGSITLPTTIGTYMVTFDVAAATGWNTAMGLYAGNLVISNQTPVESDFTVGNLTQTQGSIVAVTVTPKAGKSTGAVTVYYNDSFTLPTIVGTYDITFDVAATTGWDAVTALVGGTLTINETNQDPSAADFDIGNLIQAVGSVTAVTIMPRVGKSAGAITIRYNGSTTLPATIGTYTVTFDIAAATGWNAATGLAAGNLVIGNPFPVADDFNVSNLDQTVGSVTAVIIMPRIGKSTGAITIRYDGSTILPTAAGTYTVTFDVAATEGWSASAWLIAGTLAINHNPIAADFDVDNLTQTYGSVTAVTITPRTGKSDGALTVY